MDIWNDDWTTNENEDKIIRAKQRSHGLVVAGCLGITLTPLFIITGLVFLFIAELNSKTIVLESTSPDGEHTLIISREDNPFLKQAYFVETDDGERVSTLADVGEITESVSVTWENNDEAYIHFPNALMSTNLHYIAPNKFKVVGSEHYIETTRGR